MTAGIPVFLCYGILEITTLKPVGQSRKIEKGFPVAVSGAKLCNQGEAIAFRSDALLAMKFKDTRDVHILTTIHDESLQNVRNKRNPTKAKAHTYCGVQQAYGRR